MKKNFARVNEKFDIGIDGAEGKWTYTPTDKYTHVIRTTLFLLFCKLDK